MVIGFSLVLLPTILQNINLYGGAIWSVIYSYELAARVSDLGVKINCDFVVEHLIIFRLL